MLRFASLGTQFLAAILVTAWLGVWLDKRFAFTTPMFVWLLPLLTIIGLLIKVVKEASQK
jgi:F0F1-type ATP synthase assembly protein I